MLHFTYSYSTFDRILTSHAGRQSKYPELRTDRTDALIPTDRADL